MWAMSILPEASPERCRLPRHPHCPLLRQCLAVRPSTAPTHRDVHRTTPSRTSLAPHHADSRSCTRPANNAEYHLTAHEAYGRRSTPVIMNENSCSLPMDTEYWNYLSGSLWPVQKTALTRDQWYDNELHARLLHIKFVFMTHGSREIGLALHHVRVFSEWQIQSHVGFIKAETHGATLRAIFHATRQLCAILQAMLQG